MEKNPGGRAFVISEYGGLTLKIPGHIWKEQSYGYGKLSSQAEFQEQFRKLQEEIRALEKEGLSGAIYTQVSDIEEEINGIYTYAQAGEKIKQCRIFRSPLKTDRIPSFPTQSSKYVYNGKHKGGRGE